MRDFPDWFVEFAAQQLREYQDAELFFENRSLEELQVDYIKIWSVVESFAKIIIILAAKRNFLRELEPVIQTLSNYRDILDKCENQILLAIDYYQKSIDGSNVSNAVLDFEAIDAVKIDIKKKVAKKYSVSKNVVFKEKLPNSAEADKALGVLALEIPGFSELLNNSDKSSKFYVTRNKIAHEGIADVQIQALKLERLLPVLEVAQRLKNYVEAEARVYAEL